MPCVTPLTPTMRGHPLYPILLTSLIEAADRVDSTTGVQMAYVKQWAPRSANPLTLRVPELLPGPGRAVLGDALEVAPDAGAFDLAYLDPPYNQHRYFTNYHVWETLVAWDAPEPYGVARKRIDAARPLHAARSTRSGPCPTRCARWCAASTASCWCCPTTTSPGWRRRARGAVRRGSGGGHLGLRLGSLRRGPHRHLRPVRGQGGRVSHLSNQELLVIAGEGRWCAMWSMPPSAHTGHRARRLTTGGSWPVPAGQRRWGSASIGAT
jgi:hypothetical protein